MEPEQTPTLPVLRREVERPATTGNGLLPVLVLAAGMTSTLAAAALAMSLTPRAQPCPRYGQRVQPVVAPAASFARPAAPVAAPAAPVVEAAPAAAAAIDPACAPRIYRGNGDVQEWTFEVCASAPDPSPIIVSGGR